jgi:hypothetical protein
MLVFVAANFCLALWRSVHYCAIGVLSRSELAGLGQGELAYQVSVTHHRASVLEGLEMNGDSYRLKQSRRKRTPSSER